MVVKIEKTKIIIKRKRKTHSPSNDDIDEEKIKRKLKIKKLEKKVDEPISPNCP